MASTMVVALTFLVVILVGLVAYLTSLLMEAQRDAACAELEARALAVKLADALAAQPRYTRAYYPDRVS